jgi:hypothetical protein
MAAKEPKEHEKRSENELAADRSQLLRIGLASGPGSFAGEHLLATGKLGGA